MYDKYVFAKYLAYKAGDVLKRYFLSSNIEAREKKDKTIVTVADKTSERLIREEIEKTYPEHSILGEEEGMRKGDKWTWIIDPLDGTNNFFRGIPYFNVSVGLKHKDEYVIGVVYNPITNQMFSACKGMGAYLNDKELVCKREEKEKLFITYCSSKREDVVEKVANVFKNLRPKVDDFRKLGSSALEICYVAWGKVDVYLGYDIKPWDFAAAVVIAKEAGCNVKEGMPLIVSKPDMYKRIEEWIN
jgi:myo-inositol-1(or 4)-monophosphatase